MMTVNLEKELIKQNRKIVTPRQLLLIKEYEKVGSIDFDWEKIGFTHVDDGNNIKNTVSRWKEETLKFNQERVFHISQIESIAMKYYLRFLPSAMYKGSVDNELPLKIGTFEAAHGIKVRSKGKGYSSVTQYFEGNAFILAPMESFELQQKPKDPLFFYRINEEYYYLIHKWGNDLSLTRRIKGFCSNHLTKINPWIMNPLVFALAGISFVILMVLSAEGGLNIPFYYSFIPASVVLLGSYITSFKNNWNSPFIEE